MPDAEDVDLHDLPEPGTPEFLAGLASDEFTEAWNHLRLLSDYDPETAENLARRWRQTLASIGPDPDRRRIVQS